MASSPTAKIASSVIDTFSNIISEHDWPSIVENVFCETPSALVSTIARANSLLCKQLTITFEAFEPFKTSVLVPFNFISEIEHEGESYS